MREQDLVVYMVSSTLISFRSYWPREGTTIGYMVSSTIISQRGQDSNMYVVKNLIMKTILP